MYAVLMPAANEVASSRVADHAMHQAAAWIAQA